MMDLSCWGKKHMFDGDEMKLGERWRRAKVEQRGCICILIAVTI